MFAKSGMSAGWRRACILFLLLLVLAGCRKSAGLVVTPGQGTVSGSGEAALTGILTGVYRGEEIPLPKQVYIRSQNMGPGGIRMDRETREVTVWTMDAEGHGHIVTVKGEDVTMDDTIFDIPEDRVLQAAAFGEHCFVWVTAVYADRRFSGEEVHRIDLDTREETVRDNVRDLFATAERQEGEYGRFQITSAAVDPDGDLWLAAGEEVVVLSSNFVLRTSFVSRGYSSSLSIAPDGLVWVP
ncbi:MAG: hypothetical protein J6Q17_00140, partial [Clostridia bacterium]|nr:hypothetical protein [Clostridia bacterium]